MASKGQHRDVHVYYRKCAALLLSMTSACQSTLTRSSLLLSLLQLEHLLDDLLLLDEEGAHDAVLDHLHAS